MKECTICKKTVPVWIKDQGKNWCIPCHDKEQDRKAAGKS